MARTEAYPITYGVLGLLAFTGPMSGYDLKQTFDLALTPIWNATHSQIYAELRRMDELGWVEMERHEQEHRPDKKVYQLTDAGKQALRSWQAQQTARGLQMRDEVLLRFVFGSFAAPEDLAEILRQAIADHEQRVIQYQQNIACLPPTPAFLAGGVANGEPDPFFAELGRFAEGFENAYLTWLREALAFVERRMAAQHIVE